MSAQRRKNNKSRRKLPPDHDKSLARLEKFEQLQELGYVPGIVDVPPLLLKNKVCTFSQTYDGPDITNSIVADTYGGMNFQLASLPNSLDLSSLWDQYRFAQITVAFMPRNNMNNSTTNDFGKLLTVIDYDDSSPPTSANELRQYQTVVETKAYKPHVRTFVPHIAIGAYSGAFTSFANMKMQWLDLGSPTIQHYGIKYCQTAGVGTALTTYSTVVRIVVQVRNTR
jgi:hypothetical protein